MGNIPVSVDDLVLGVDTASHHPWVSENNFGLGVYLDGYISCFPNAVTKPNDKSNLQNKVFNWACDIDGLGCVVAEQRHGGKSTWEHTWGRVNPQP